MVARELLPLSPGSSEETRPLVGGSPAQPQPRGQRFTSRCLGISAASAIAALLMLSGLSRGIVMQGKRKFSLVDRYDMWTVKSENQQLKDLLVGYNDR